MMKILDKIRDVFERLVDMLSFSIFLFIGLIGFYALFDIHRVTVSAKLDEEMVAIADSIADEPGQSFDDLKAINDEIIAWLRLKGTSIDLPVVWYSRDNNKYLTRNYRGENATAGAAFVDYRNHALNDNYSVIYAHRMNEGRMFSDITKFIDREYFNSHNAGTLYLPDITYDLTVILAARPNVSTTRIYNVDLYLGADYAKILSLLESEIVNRREVTVNPGDKLLLLSTCDKDANHYRNVVLVKMTPRTE